MTPVAPEWASVEDRCVQLGWGLGIGVGLLVGMVGLLAGGPPELSAVRGGLALVCFALLGWFTGILMTRFAPEKVEPKDEEIEPIDMEGDTLMGINVDQTIGDEDPVWSDEAEPVSLELPAGSDAA